MKKMGLQSGRKRFAAKAAGKALCLMLAGAAGTAWGADLLSVYREALAYDAQYASARSTLEAGREKLPQGRAGLLPTVGVAANTTWNDMDYKLRTTPPMNFPFNYNSSGWTATLTQPLFRWQNWVNYNQSELQVAQAEAQFVAAQQDLITRVAQAYFDVLLAQETLATTQAQKAAIAEQLEAAKRNFEVGTATITDTDEAQSRHDLAVAQEIAAQNDLVVKRHTLAMIVGADHPSLKALRPNLQIGRPQPDSMDKWTESAETGNPAVAASKAGAEIASLEADKQRAGHYPTLDLVATRGRNSQTTNFSPSLGILPGNDTNATTVGVQLAIPIFAGGSVNSRTREAVALREKARADLDNARRTAVLQARQAYLGVTSGLSQVKAYEAALVSSQSALESNKLGYEVGVRINIDVLNAQGQLYDTKQRLAKARLDTLMAQLKLKAAAGNLTEDDLAAINALLE